MFDAPVTIAQAIQLALAPVFLLTGIAALVAVFNTQLGRISDRVEMLRGKSHDSPELPQLARRGQLLLFAFACVTLAGILIAAVIAAIFWGFFNLTNLTSVIAVLFLSATLLLGISLVLFLLEVYISVRHLRRRPRRLRQSPAHHPDKND